MQGSRNCSTQSRVIEGCRCYYRSDKCCEAEHSNKEDQQLVEKDRCNGGGYNNNSILVDGCNGGSSSKGHLKDCSRIKEKRKSYKILMEEIEEMLQDPAPSLSQEGCMQHPQHHLRLQYVQAFVPPSRASTASQAT